MLGLAGETLAQAGVLRADADGAGVLLAVALHEAAEGDQGCRGKAELLGAQQGSDRDVAAVHELAVRLQHHARAQAVGQQGLLRLGEAQLQRQARVVDRVARRGAGAAVGAGDGDLGRAALCDAGGDGAHTGLGDELDGDARVGVGVLEVKDELGQVLDRVDVVVGRRADQADAGRGVAHLGNPGEDLLAGQVAALAGFGALRHLDLDLDRGGEVAARHTEATRGDLLDRRIGGIAVGARDLAHGVLAALARVGAAADAVHRDGEALVRLLGDGSVAHGAGVEALDDLGGGLDLVEGHGARRGGHELQQVAQDDRAPLRVQVLAVELEGLVIVLADRLLQQVDGLRVDHVLLAAQGAPLGEAAAGQLVGGRRPVEGERGVVALVQRALDVGDREAAQTAGRIGEVPVDDLLRQAHRLKDLCGVVALQRGDAHLGGDCHDAVDDRGVVIGDALLGGHGDGAPLGEAGDAGVGEVGVDARCGVADQRGEVVRRDGIARLDDNVGAHAQTAAEQVVVDGPEGQQARDGHLAFGRTVGEDHDVDTVAHRRLDLGAQGVERLFERPALAIEGAGKRLGAQADAVERADAGKLVRVEDRRREAQQAAVAAAVLEDVAVRAERELGRRLEALAQGVDGRVGDLGEALVEVAVEGLRVRREHGQRLVGAHGGERRFAGLGHRADDLVDVVVVVAVARQALGLGNLIVGLRDGSVRLCGDVAQVDDLLVEPVAVGLFGGVGVADLVVPDHAALVGVHKEHLAGPERAGDQQLGGGDVERAGLGCEDQAVVAGQVVACGAQAVAVERGAGVASVGVGDRGGTVPGLGQERLVLVEGAARLAELFIVVPRLGQQHADGAGERAAVHHHELEHVVEDGGVGALAVDDRQRLGHGSAQAGGVEVALARADPVDVAAQRVDLAIVDEQAVGVRALPAGRGVGGVARVHEGERGLHRGVREVHVEAAHLGGDQHALVDDGPRAHRAHVKDLARQRRLSRGALLDRAAREVQAALKGVAGRYLVGAAEEGLLDGGHAVERGLTQVSRVARHAAPEKQGHAALCADGLEDLLCGTDALVVLREEEHCDAVVALARQQGAVALRLLVEEAVRYLEEDAGAVARVALQAATAAVLEVDEDGERVVDDRVAADALEVGDDADAAGVVVEFLPVQAAGASGVRGVGRWREFRRKAVVMQCHGVTPYHERSAVRPHFPNNRTVTTNDFCGSRDPKYVR